MWMDWMLQSKDRVADWIKKQKETNLRAKDIYRLKVKGWEKIFHDSGQDRKAGVAILISDKIDFKTKTVIRHKEGLYMMIKESNQEDTDITHIWNLI